MAPSPRPTRTPRPSPGRGPPGCGKSQQVGRTRSRLNVRSVGRYVHRGHAAPLTKSQRLREVETAWDPRNLLRCNKNITPATTG
ncbi:BBE domain-containing protein [Streptomyces canus]|uniref:BBE domain-containing protein n=1 Tax=Streptomyces canus TaxID=58343 RepID=UPI00358E77C0